MTIFVIWRGVIEPYLVIPIPTQNVSLSLPLFAIVIILS